MFHTGALREHQQIVPALDGLQGVFHRLDVPLSPVHGEGAQLPQHPVKDPVAEQLFLGHDVEPVVHRDLQCHQHRVPVAVVVGAQERAVLRQVLPSDDGDWMEDPRHRRHQIVDHHEEPVERPFFLRLPAPLLFLSHLFAHTPALSRMICSSAASLWAKSSAVVSSSTASSAFRRGAAARWVSFQSRSWMEERTSS